jgi:hypothetical protein
MRHPIHRSEQARYSASWALFSHGSSCTASPLTVPPRPLAEGGVDEVAERPELVGP